jgi:hypothetical protein
VRGLPASVKQAAILKGLPTPDQEGGPLRPNTAFPARATTLDGLQVTTGCVALIFPHKGASGIPMLPLDKVVAGAKVRGLAGAVPVEVVRTEWIGSDARTWSTGAPTARPRCCSSATPSHGSNLSQATRAFSFDGDGEAFRIATEAQRIRLASLSCLVTEAAPACTGPPAGAVCPSSVVSPEDTGAVG